MIISDQYQKIQKYFQDDIWKESVDDKIWLKRVGIQLIKILILSYMGFRDDKVKLRASALTFFSLLSIVPVLAMAFGIAKGFGLDKEFETQLVEKFSGQQEVLGKSLEFAHTLLENTKGGLIAGIGMILLIYSVMELLNNVEKSFNDIWYIKEERPFVRKFTDYMSIILLAPVLMIVSNSLTVFITIEIRELTDKVTFIALFKGLIFPALRLLPYIVIWLLFTLIYLIMPNTRVKLKSAFFAGVIAGTAFLITQWVLIRLQVNVSEFNAIYGSFAVLPLFLSWLQISWLIMLFGAEISYSHQNIRKFEYERETIHYSDNNKKLTSLLVTHLVVKKFTAAEDAVSFSEINQTLKVPSRYLREILDLLIRCKLISIVSNNSHEKYYQPAVDTDHLSIAYVIEKIDESGSNEEIYLRDDLAEQFLHSFDSFKQSMQNSPNNKLLKNI